MTRNLVDQFHLRATLRRAIRDFFDKRGYLEIETPCLVATPGTEVYLNYFDTSWTSLAGGIQPLYLRSSPELHMKQALAAGCRKIFQIGPCFRNVGEIGPWHHPEFSMLEWYHCGGAYEPFMTETIDLLRHCAVELRSIGQQTLQLPENIPKFTVAGAFKEFSNIELIDLDLKLAEKAKKAGVVSIRGDEDFDTAFFKILLEKVEPALAKHRVSILCDYPASQAALAVVAGGVAKRFEVFVDGIELSNAFLELSGREENSARIKQSAEKRAAVGLPSVPEDLDFLAAMSVKLPETVGNALGFDRLLAVLLEDPGIAGVVPFRQASVWQKYLP